MSATLQRTVALLEEFDEHEQDFAFNILTQIMQFRETSREKRNADYIAKIQRGIKQCAEGRGITRDIIEVSVQTFDKI